MPSPQAPNTTSSAPPLAFEQFQQQQMHLQQQQYQAYLQQQQQIQYPAQHQLHVMLRETNGAKSIEIVTKTNFNDHARDRALNHCNNALKRRKLD
jgi:hypothetical protein